MARGASMRISVGGDVQGSTALPPDDHIERDRALAEVVERVDIAAAQREVVGVLRALPGLRVQKRVYERKPGQRCRFRGELQKLGGLRGFEVLGGGAEKLLVEVGEEVAVEIGERRARVGLGERIDTGNELPTERRGPLPHHGPSRRSAEPSMAQQSCSRSVGRISFGAESPPSPISSSRPG